jgi:sugar phosphate isomerase/epimerase
MNWELGISTGIAYRSPIGDVLESIREAGFCSVELSTAPQHFDYGRQESVSDLKGRIDALGLKVCSLHAPFGHDVNVTSPETSERENAIAMLTRAADALAFLGGGLYVIHPGGEDQRWVWEREQRLARSVHVLTRIWEICRARELELVVETPLPHLLGGTPADFQWILERIPREHTGVCVDTSHCSLGGNLLEPFQRFPYRIVHVQVSDNRGHSDDHLPPGQGVIDWDAFCQGLAAAGYGGTFMLEVAGVGLLKEDLRVLRESLRRAIPAALAPRECLA